METEQTELERQLVLFFRQLRPYGKLEVAMNQDGSRVTIELHNRPAPVRKVLET